MPMEIPVALVRAAAEPGAKTEPNAIGVRVETALVALFAVTAVLATSFVAALTGLI